jgi:hypothetical protein
MTVDLPPAAWNAIATMRADLRVSTAALSDGLRGLRCSAHDGVVAPTHRRIVL